MTFIKTDLDPLRHPDACDHDWQPVPLEMRQYRCSRCDATGERKRGVADIVAHDVPRQRKREINVRPLGDEPVASQTDWGMRREGRRVAPKKPLP